MFTLTFQDRKFIEQSVGRVQWTVERLTWRAVGGCWSAQLKATAAGAVGNEQAALWYLSNLLRYGVTIRDEAGPAWWGYISAVSIVSRGWYVRFSMDEMSNRVAIVYNELSPNPYTGPKVYTPFVEDADSIREYGRKVGVYDLGASTPTDAVRTAAGKLAELGRPVASVQAAAEEAGAAVGTYAVVECRGWWSTLEWEYYEDLLGRDGNTEGGSSQNMGDTAGTAQLAQSFAPSSSWPLVEVWLRTKRFRAADNLVVQIRDNGAGIPGVNVLGSATVAAASLFEEQSWYKVRLAAPVNLAAGTTYWVVVSRSGAISVLDYFTFGVNEKLTYASGVMRIWNGAAWVARAPDADMGFILLGEDDTNNLIGRMLGAAQLLNGYRIETASGRKGRIYREGSRRIREEVESLLKDGTSSGLRYLAAVDPARVARIYTQPWRDDSGAGMTAARLGPAGYLVDGGGRLLRASAQPAGAWVHLGAAAGPAGMTRISSIFAESVIFDGHGLRLGGV